MPKPNNSHADSTAAAKPEALPLTSNTRASKPDGHPKLKLLGAKSKNAMGDNIETTLYVDTNVHEITVFITGSIDVKSLDNKYVTKPNKKKYTIETKATDHFLISSGRRPPQPAQIEPIAMTGFVLNMTGFFLHMTGFVLHMTGFVLKMIGFVLNMTGLVLNMTGFVLNMA